MKILYISNLNPHFENTNIYRLKALKQLGHEPIFFNDRIFIIPGRIRQRVPILQNWDLRRLNQQMLRVAAKIKPDICLAVGGHRILPRTLITLKKSGIITKLWTTDPPHTGFNHIIHTAPLYDHVFCAGTEAMEILAHTGGKNTTWLPYACDPEFHRPLDMVEADRVLYGRDIAFVGAFYPNRWEIFKELIGNYNIGIWGPGWQQVINDQNRNHIQAIPLSHFEWIKIYNSAKIVIIIHYQDGKTPCYQASPKVYEALACRSFVMVDSQKDVLKIFSSGQHLVSFNCIEDLNLKIDYFLNRDNERRAIAAEGYREVLDKHTYRHRMKMMIEKGFTGL